MASEWVPYTGPRGGKGWQHMTSGQVVYGDKPGEQAKPEQSPQAEKPVPRPEQETTAWHPVGEGLWQHPKTGELVKGKSAPSASETASVLEQARQRTRHPSQEPKPAAAPPPQPAAPRSASPEGRAGAKMNPRSVDELVKELDALPDGVEILGWKKETPMGFGMPLWTRKDEAKTTAGMVKAHGVMGIRGAMPDPQAAAPEPAKGDRAFSPEELDDVGAVSAMFGIAPGDVGNEQQLRLFLRRTARHVGFDPDKVPGDKTDKAVAAAQFLRQRRGHLEGLVKMAQGYGWGGGSGRELAQRARHAGLYLVKKAVQEGYEVSGDTEQEHLAGALDYLHHREQERRPGHDVGGVIGQALQRMLAGSRSGRISWWDVAMAAVGFYVGYQLMRRLRRKGRDRSL